METLDGPQARKPGAVPGDRHREVYEAFRWEVPERFNVARYCCDRWATERHRLALYWEDESGETRTLSFWDLQQAANRLANGLGALGVLWSTTPVRLWPAVIVVGLTAGVEWHRGWWTSRGVPA